MYMNTKIEALKFERFFFALSDPLKKKNQNSSSLFIFFAAKHKKINKKSVKKFSILVYVEKR